jgi:hypothetical protein
VTVATARTQALLEAAALATALLVTGLLLFTAYGALAPGSQALPPFNSDSAVPVLMANGWRWDVFHAFYLGQDRFASWPFLLAHGVGGLSGRPVTPESLHLLATLFVLLGAVPAALLCRPWPGLGLLAYTVALLVPESRGSIFEIAQPYAWQLPLLFWAWWCLRQSWKARGRQKQVLWLAATTAVCFLASWMSSLSGPLLLGLTLVEGLNRQTHPSAPSRKRWLLQLLPALFAIAGEACLRGAYHRYIRLTFQRNFRTRLSLDWGHFASNAGEVWAGLAQPRLLVALAVLGSYTAGLLVRRQRGQPLGSGLRAVQCTVLGSFLLALLPLPVLVLVRHIRMNFFAQRYFAPTDVFLLFGALVAVSSFLPARRRGLSGAAWLAAGTAILAALALLVLPRAEADPAYARMRATARALAQKAPGAVLLDGYWGTYVFAGLATPGALLPLPRYGDLNRTPEAEAHLEGASQVLAGHRDFLAEAGSEPPFLFQHGTLLQRVQADFFSDGVDRFSLYQPRAVQTLALRGQPPLDELDLAKGSAEVHLSADRGEAGTVLAVEIGCLFLETPATGLGDGVDGARVPLQVQAVPGAIFFSAPPDVAIRAFHLSFGSAACKVRQARWYRRPD